MLTVKELAERLRISRSLAYRLVQTGEIASVRIASAIRVLESDLAEYLDRQKVEPQQAFTHLKL